MIHFAILGAGTIAKVMARTVNGMIKNGNTEIELSAVASRSKEKASAFADDFDIEKSYGSYEELYNDADIDLVYIATPHNFHYEQAKACLNHGKNVLCEKPFTVNAKQAKELIELAREKNLFIEEAIWTRYMPIRKVIDDIIASGIVGEPMLVTANLGYQIIANERLAKPELAGGALLDVGVYTLNFANMILGDCDSVDATCVKNASGVDLSNSMTLKYKDSPKMSVLCSSSISVSDRYGMIHCSKGFIQVENINNPQSVKVYDTEYKLVKEVSAPRQITGFEYEVEQSMEAIKAKKPECSAMPHDKILYMMNLMDSIRAQLGIKYPFE